MRPLSRPEPSDLTAARPRMGDVPFPDLPAGYRRVTRTDLRRVPVIPDAFFVPAPEEAAEAERLATWDRVLP